jgi:hypothetical protein
MSRCKVKDPNTKFHKNPSSGNIVIPCWQTDRQTDTKKLIDAFGNCFENALKNAKKIHDNRFAAGHRTKHLCNICHMLAVLKPNHYTYSTVTCWLTQRNEWQSVDRACWRYYVQNTELCLVTARTWHSEEVYYNDKRLNINEDVAYKKYK